MIRDGNILGRVIDTFVAAQLRAETDVAAARPRLHHLRTKESRQEIDLVAELAGHGLIAIEIKAGAAPDREEARHVRWLRDKHESQFVVGVLLHTGSRVYEIDDRIVAAPISVLWG